MIAVIDLTSEKVRTSSPFLTQLFTFTEFTNSAKSSKTRNCKLIQEFKTGYVPEKSLFYPELTLYQSLYFAIKLRNEAESEIHNPNQRISEILESIGLLGYQNRRGLELPSEIQKIASIAHVLLDKPRTLYLDYPPIRPDPCDVIPVLTLLKQLNSKGIEIILTVRDRFDPFVFDMISVIDQSNKLIFSYKPDEFIPEVTEWVGAASFLPTAQKSDVTLFI